MTQHPWESYDAIAGAYDRVRGPQYAPIARGLAALTNPIEGAAVLDLGTGTGVAATAVAQTLGHSFVVGIDPSAAMLLLARANAPVAPVAGRSPGLPFATRSFDVVVANLVLSHFEQYEAALADAVRVLRPGGRVGATAWGTLDHDDPVEDSAQRELTRIWRSVAARFVDLDSAEEALGGACSREAWFADPAHLRIALERAGLRRVELSSRTYECDTSQGELLAGYESSSWGRYLAHVLGEAGWTQLQHEAADAVRSALPDPMTRVDQVLIAVGTKPYDGRP